MKSQTAYDIDYQRQNKLWQSIQQIPETVLSEYLDDNIIDDEEIEDITLRLEAHMSSLNISPADHAMIRQMVRQSVKHLQEQQIQQSGGVAGKLGSATLNDIRAVMGGLLANGHIALQFADVEYGDQLTPNSAIPEERPDNYDDEAPNLIK